MKSRASVRWVIYIALFALTLVAARLGDAPAEPRATSRTQTAAVASAPTISKGLKEAKIPGVDLERLAPRALRDVTADAFNALSWQDLEAEEARRNAPPPAPPPSPQPPPLPYGFMGKLIDGETTVVFITKGDRNYTVRLGDTVDGTYRVEEIGERTMTLTYLPLDARQALEIGTSTAAALGAARARESATTDIPQPLRISAPPTRDLTKLIRVGPPQVAFEGGSQSTAAGNHRKPISDARADAVDLKALF